MPKGFSNIESIPSIHSIKWPQGNKWENKTYISHSGYPGGQKIKTAQQVFDKNPSDLIEKAVKGMLPKNKLGAELFRNLYVVSGAEHPYDGQKPTAVNINELN
mgnify:CR=1 FL=1